MLANFLSKTRPINYLTILFLLFIFFMVSIISDKNLQWNFIGFIRILSNLIALFFMVLLVSFVVQKNRLTRDNSFVLFVFVLFLGMFSMAMNWSYIFLANIFLLISLRRIYSLKNNVRTPIKIFDASFWLGISVLFYPNVLLFWMIILMGMIFYSKWNFKYVLISVLGTLLPIFLFYVYCFTFNQLPFFNQLLDFSFSFDFSNYSQISILISLTILISLLIWSVLSVTSGLYKVSKKNQASWFLLLFNLMIAGIVSFGSVHKNGSELIFLFFPTSIIIANYLQKEKDKWFRNLVLYVLFFVSIGVYFL